MVMTTAELISSLQNEVRILLHLAGMVDRSMLDYRPTPQQRSTIELLQYLTMMGPELIRAIRAGAFDGGAWAGAEQSASTLSFNDVLSAIAAQKAGYAEALGDITEAELRREVALFGEPASVGSTLVNQVLCGCAAYRTQLFLYLKACGRHELTTLNLWAGVDGPPS
jgi:hypothetical protein